MKSNIHHSPYVVPVLLCVLLLPVLLILRLPAYFEPLERDITTYAVIAHELLQGRELYSDLWDHKPPMTYLTYAAAELLVGYGPHQVFFLNVVMAGLVLFGVYFAALRATGTRAGGFWAAACWTAISAYIPLQANQPNTELLINACLVWALVLILKSRQNFATLLLIGILFTLASMYKQITVVLSATLAVAYVLYPPPAITRRRAVFDMLLVACVGIIGWLLLSGYFAVQGRFEDYYQAVFDYNIAYSSTISVVEEPNRGLLGSLWYGFTPAGLMPEVFGLAPLLYGVTLLGLMWGWRRAPRTWILLAGYLFAVPIMIALPGKFFSHYYQFWLPILAIGCGIGLAELQRRLRARCLPRPEALAAGTSAVFVAALLYWQLPFFSLSPGNISRIKYDSDIFVIVEAVGKEVGTLLQPEESFYQWGDESGLYFYSERSPAAGLLSYYPLLAGPYTKQYLWRLVQDWEDKWPELFVVPHNDLPYPPAYVMQKWVATYYRPAPNNNQRDPGFQFYVLKGGRLEKRLFYTSTRINPGF